MILVGASIRSAAESARNAGFRVTGIDLFGDVDTHRLCDRFTTLGELSALAPSGFDDWVAACPSGSFLQVGGILGEEREVIGRLAKTRPSMGPTDRQRLDITDPQWLGRSARQAGVSFPTTFRSDRLLSDHRLRDPDTPSGQPGHWLCKTSLASSPSSGGLGVRWLTAKESSQVGSSCKLWQRWIAGRVIGASYYSDGRSVCLLGVCRSSTHRIGDRPFVYAGSFGPIELPASITERLRRLGETIVNRTEFAGLFGADLIVNQSRELTLLEINPRWTASSELVERDLRHRCCRIPGTTLIGATIDQVNATEMRAAIESAPSRVDVCYWKRVLYARHAGRLSHALLPVVANAAFQPRTIGDVQFRFADVPKDGHRVEKNEPILSLIMRIPSDARRPMKFPPREARELMADVQRAVE